MPGSPHETPPFKVLFTVLNYDHPALVLEVFQPSNFSKIAERQAADEQIRARLDFLCNAWAFACNFTMLTLY